MIKFSTFVTANESSMIKDTPPFFHTFNTNVANYSLPLNFTFPFSYEPDLLSSCAAREVQNYLTRQTDFKHNFGLTESQEPGLGKMFGVLVVQAHDKRLGYLAACSGKLAGTNKHAFFVPPVFDMLTHDSFFLQEETKINALNREIEQLESADILSKNRKLVEELRTQAELALSNFRHHMKTEKGIRKNRRETNKPILPEKEYTLLIEDLIKQSYRDQHELDILKSEWKTKIQTVQSDIDALEAQIEKLRTTRREKSSTLQRKLFNQYRFLNIRGEQKSLLEIFELERMRVPPAGAGECAGPKLLQYAFANGLTPISMMEFWWGASPSSEIRKHKQYYPACKSKCEPILSHMLTGLNVDPNPLLKNPASDKEFEIIYQDESIIVVNKPAEFLSVPGIHIKDSVYQRILDRFPEITGPVIIHRLDMSTSGILILAKNKHAHQFIQDQFIKHTVIKQYTALLEGELSTKEGIIDLPLRVDLDDRPRQMVCYQHGKPAQTRYKVVSHEHGNTRIHFFPLSGRTHQLRVHAAHHLGLNQPIVGDDLYGTKSDRLHLHAGYIAFIHPDFRKKVSFTVPDPF